MRTILLFLALFPICTELVSQNYPYGIIPTMASSQDVDDSYEELRDALTEVDLEGKPSLRVTDGDTKTEYQSFAMIAAALNEDSITFEKLWNWVKYHSDLNTSHNNMYPWRILEVGELRGPVADGDTDIAIALDLAARRWPNWTDGQYDWDYYAKDYIDKIYDHTRAVSLNADSPNVLGGKRIGHPTDEHYYIHYQAYGYYNNYRDRTEESNWTNTGTEMPSVFQTTVDMQRKILGKYYSDENTNPYYWPPHQVDKNGEVAMMQVIGVLTGALRG